MMGLQTLMRGLVLLHVVTLSASLISFSKNMDWLRSDGTGPYFGGEFDEGDTTICRCRITINEGPPVESLEFEMMPYGSSPWPSDDFVTIARGEQIVYSDGQARFSDVNLTVVNVNTTDYRMTLSNVDRYDSGNRYFCKAIWSGAGATSSTTSTELKVRWSPPEPRCSSDIPDKAKEGDDATYECDATDRDGRSEGTFSMWRGDTKLEASINSTNLYVGMQYNASYSTAITDDSLRDVYSCRYIGTGGFQEYDYNCTFNMPMCVVDDLKDQCSGALPSRDQLHIITVFFVLVFYYVTFK